MVAKNAKIWGVGIMWEGPDMRSNLFLSVVEKFPQFLIYHYHYMACADFKLFIPPAFALPTDIPVPPATESKYEFSDFSPDAEWTTDIGEAGAVNRESEVRFGNRINGLKLVERGPETEATRWKYHKNAPDCETSDVDDDFTDEIEAETLDEDDNNPDSDVTADPDDIAEDGSSKETT
ncbi:hypothetical protein F4604DRAFT_1682164 [Suillus subluteus]|nr:hypothetical protein F4604DRAFT_1682164 [Suillus subluteus]